VTLPVDDGATRMVARDRRVDRWLWAVRLYKTRSVATAACDSGHVRINGSAAKPARRIRVGDCIEALAGGRTRVVEVVRLVDARVGAPVAAQCFVDHSPPAPTEARVPRAAMRPPGSGRPTKRDRRRLDRLQGG